LIEEREGKRQGNGGDGKKGRGREGKREGKGGNVQLLCPPRDQILAGPPATFHIVLGDVLGTT